MENLSSNAVALDVPFVYRFLGTNRVQRNYRHRWAMGRTTLVLPRLDRLPPPIYTVSRADLPQTPWLAWHHIGGALLRPVMIDDVPADLAEIEHPLGLISPAWNLEEWFVDHPSALFRVPLRTRRYSHWEHVTDASQYVMAESDLEVSRAATVRNWAACAENGGNILAPSAPPTWRVRVGRGFGYLDVSYLSMPMVPLILPEFHFAIQDEQAARDFAAQVMEGDDLRTDGSVCTYPIEGPGMTGGSLASARALAFHLCARLAGRNADAFSTEQLALYRRLRDLFEHFGSDEEAAAILRDAEEVQWSGIGSTLHEWLRLLPIRRQAIENLGDLRAMATIGLD